MEEKKQMENTFNPIGYEQLQSRKTSQNRKIRL